MDVSAGAAAMGVALAVLVPGAAAAKPACDGRVLAVTHFDLTTGAADSGARGPSLGDVYTFTGPVYRPGSRTDRAGSIEGVTITTALNEPTAGRETRAVNIGFRLPDLANQVSVGGLAAYPMGVATLAANTVSYRPITGGTGRFAGVRGWLKTTHFTAGYWRQEFHFCPTAR